MRITDERFFNLRHELQQRYHVTRITTEVVISDHSHIVSFHVPLHGLVVLKVAATDIRTSEYMHKFLQQLYSHPIIQKIDAQHDTEIHALQFRD